MTPGTDATAETGGPLAEPDKPLAVKIGSAVRWSAFNSLLQRVSQVAVSIVLARLIAPEQFGVFAVALVVLNIVLNISELGVSVALVRATGPIKHMAPTVTTISLASGAVLALLCFTGAPWFASALGAPEATGVIQLMSVALLIAGASAVPSALLQRGFRQDHKFIADTSGFAVGTAVAILLAVLGFGPWSLAWSRVATNATTAVIMFALTKERYRPGFDRTQARAVLAFGLPLAGSSLLIFGVMNVDYIVIGSMLGTLSLGLYTLAFNLSSWPVGAFSAPIRSVSLAAFSQLRDDPVRFQRSFSRALGLLALFTVPACVLLGALGEPLIRFVYGERWAAAAAPLALLVLVGALRVALELAYDYLASAGHSKAILTIHLLWLAALIPTLAVAAHLDGIRAVAAGHVVVVVLVVVPAYLVAFRPLGVRAAALASSLTRPVLGGLVMIAVAVTVQRLVDGDATQLLLGGLLSIAAYAAVMYPMRHEALRLLRRQA